MRFLLLNHFQNARDSLRMNRMRSFLTMIGITIGVASITTILALGAGASKVVSDQIEALGGTIAVVRPGTTDISGIDQLVQLPTQQQYAASTLSLADVNTIAEIDGVQEVAPLMIISGSINGSNVAPSTTPIIATSPSLAEVNDLAIEEGQFLDPALRISSVVIGPQLSIDAFGTEQSIGKTLTIKGTAFTVVGVLKRTNTPLNFNGVDFDAAAFITVESGTVLNQGVPQIQQVNIRGESLARFDQMIIDTNKALLRNHLGQADFSVLSGETVAQPTNRLFTAIVAITTAIAAISLIVGGVGIMNSMLVGVAERTREIGIRKALGASNRDIVGQFMIESLALSFGGGVIGFFTGYLAAFLISAFLPFDPLFSWFTVGVAALVSLVVGMLFGLYPAIRAAHKDPINALRQYD
jgi:putative ABC transport system permease protein